jgi:hypothetical protein
MIRNPLQFIHLSSLKQELLNECILTTCIIHSVILSLTASHTTDNIAAAWGPITLPVQQCSVLCFKKLSVLLHALHFTINEHEFQFTQEITKSSAKSCILYDATLIYTAVHGKQSMLTE